MKTAFNYAAMAAGFVSTLACGYAALHGMEPLVPGQTGITDLPLAAIGGTLASAATFCYGYVKITRPPQP